MAPMSQTSLWQLVGRVHGAIYRASGFRQMKIPMTPQRVLESGGIIEAG